MKKFAAFVFMIAMSCACFAQKAALSPQARLFLLKAKKDGRYTPLPGYVYTEGPDNQLYINTLIKVDGVQVSSLAALGAKTGTQAGDIWTVRVPLQAIDNFISLDGIRYIEFDQPVFSDMDSARVLTRVDSVHAGIGLPMPYTGKDVVVGIIDAGFDYSHVGLYDTSATVFRLKRVWEQKKPGVPPSQFFYGNELVTSTSMFNAKTDAFGFSHGAHVAGIAAGSGYGGDNTNAQYRGMAYKSDLVFVGITPFQNSWINTGLSEIIDGISYVFSYAAIQGKPAVANLSWGCTIGPHDGSSLFSQACDNLTGPGRIFTCSAGNNGQNAIHFNKSFSSADTIINTKLNLPDVQGEKRAWLDAWGDTAQSFCLKATLFNGTGQPTDQTSFYCTADNNSSAYSFYLIGQDGDTCFFDIAIDSATFNLKPRIFCDIYNKSTDMLIITLTANAGTVDMWTGYVKNKTGYYGSFIQYGGALPTAAGNTYSTISDISSTHSAIAVAAYASKTNFTNILGDPVSYNWYVPKGNIAPFSSLGPTADQRVKPDIAGPGLVLGSAVSSYDTTFALTTGSNYPSVVSSYYNSQNGRSYQYAMLMGTSMSSPAAAGIVALMLEVNDTLGPETVKEVLKQTAIKDNFTGTIPPSGSIVWGHGKINAYGAILAILPILGVETLSSSGGHGLPAIVYPNPGRGLYSIDCVAEGKEELLVEAFTISGAKVYSRASQLQPGTNTLTLDLSSQPPGIYFTKLSSGKGTMTVKITKE